MIYLDYMATTPVDPAVVDVMNECLLYDGDFGNPASRTHAFGTAAAKRVNDAQAEVARCINANPQDIIWTSGATESNNLAIKGAALAYQRKGKHIVTVSTEHKAVLDTCQYLQTIGFDVTYIDPDANGRVSQKALQGALRDDTTLVSVMLVNNETGVIQDIAELTACTNKRGIIFHCDAAQAMGKIPIDVNALGVDLLSLSAHKAYGPKGVGVLYVRQSAPRIRLVAQIHGGGHQRGMRSGTLPTHQIVGAARAFQLATELLPQEQLRLTKLCEKLWQGLQAVGGVHLHGDMAHQVPNCLNLYFDNVTITSLLTALPDLAFSGGSACNSHNPEPSHVLLGMSVQPSEANQSIRLSIGRFTTEDDIEQVVQQFKRAVTEIRAQSKACSNSR